MSYQNVQGLNCNKLLVLSEFETNIKLMCFVETWLNTSGITSIEALNCPRGKGEESATDNYFSSRTIDAVTITGNYENSIIND